jgi:hypothetical protein
MKNDRHMKYVSKERQTHQVFHLEVGGTGDSGLGLMECYNKLKFKLKLVGREGKQLRTQRIHHTKVTFIVGRDGKPTGRTPFRKIIR